MRLALVKSDFMDDWYLIERAEHDGRAWLQSTGPNSSALMCSSRFSDADVEGTAEEMLGLAQAIKGRGKEFFKRCSVSVKGERVEFASPRNSQRPGVVSLAEADELADEIIAKLRPAPEPEAKP